MPDASTTMTPAPQHMRALSRANEVRLARAMLKRDVRARRISVGEVILTCPREVQTMTAAELLASQLHWGTARVRKFLSDNDITETKTVGSLTDRQRRKLAELV